MNMKTIILMSLIIFMTIFSCSEEDAGDSNESIPVNNSSTSSNINNTSTDSTITNNSSADNTSNTTDSGSNSSNSNTSSDTTENTSTESNTTSSENLENDSSETNYYSSGIIITDNTNGTWFNRSLSVYGLKMVIAGAVGGQMAVPDEWAYKVAQLVKLLLDSSAQGINQDAQLNLIKTLKGESGTWHAGYPTVQRIAYGGGNTYSPNPLYDEGIASYDGYEKFLDSHSANDMVWYKNIDSQFTGNDDIVEVTEHIFHTLHLFGVRGAVSGSSEALNSNSEQSGFKETELWLAMKEAIDNGVYGVNDYGDGDPSNPDVAEVMMKEYMYLLNFNMWSWGSIFWEGGTLAPEWNDNSRTPQSILTNNPLGYSLFNTYFLPVLSKPSIESLQAIFKDNDGGESGYQSDDQ
jgi:hypothetical protein